MGMVEKGGCCGDRAQEKGVRKGLDKYKNNV